MKITVSSALCFWLTVGAAASSQPLPAIFADVPIQLAPARIVAQFPALTFLENIAIDDQGTIFVTSLEEGKIYKVTLGGDKSEFAQLAGQVAGLAFTFKGDLLATGWTGGDMPTVFRVSRRGQVETLATVDGAVFLNGVTHLEGDRFLIADSYRGAIWEFNELSRSYRVWLEDEALARSDAQNPFPGVNGMKVFGDALYVTNTERQQLLRIPIGQGGKAGKPHVLCEGINGDDFAVDATGTLYLTTHVYDSVVRVTQDCDVTVLAGNDEGVTGSTALAFGRDENNLQAVFVVTNGGMSLPPKGGVQPAKVVRLEVGASKAK